jgi:hypothetical protein
VYELLDFIILENEGVLREDGQVKLVHKVCLSHPLEQVIFVCFCPLIVNLELLFGI